jgi:hypothetical protein
MAASDESHEHRHRLKLVDNSAENHAPTRSRFASAPRPWGLLREPTILAGSGGGPLQVRFINVHYPAGISAEEAQQLIGNGESGPD